MNNETLKTAMAECARFLTRARELDKQKCTGNFYGCKESGAVRRASMDLTRALANLRKS